MRSPYPRLAAIARFALGTLAALAIATPASAQVGGLRNSATPDEGEIAIGHPRLRALTVTLIALP